VTQRPVLHGGLAERMMRAGLLALSRRRSLGRVATRLPIARTMVRRFVAGQTLAEALDAIERLRARGFLTTVDILGESVASADDAASAVDAYLETLDALAARDLDRNVSLKLSQMGLGIDAGLARDNVARIVEQAVALGAFVRIDMEDHSTVEATLRLWEEVRPTADVRGAADVGVVMQAALLRTPADVERLIADGARIRLCKGAYQEPARVAHQDRPDIDSAFLGLQESLLLRGRYPALATHDPAMIRSAISIARDRGIERDRFEFQMLYGVRRDLQERLVSAGYRVRVHVPFGRQWYPYFMRRLAERPANVAFLLRSLLQEGRAG
jgi:proline dehydrogenase